MLNPYLGRRFAGLPAAFWIALLVLALNDHALKGSGLLPAAVTGKLSDFAGLIVAPVLLCAAFSARTDRVRGLLFGAVALGFAAIKLSPALADGAGRGLTALGIPSRIWCDPTDLVAFAVLPYAARIAQSIEPAPSRIVRRLALGIASLACVATSEDGPMEAELTGPFLINWTHAEIDAEVERRTIPCDADAEEIERNATELDRFSLGPAQMVELGWVLEELDSGSPQCGLADISVGDAQLRVRWQRTASEPRSSDLESPDPPDAGNTTWYVAHDDAWVFERGVTVYGSASHPLFEVGALLREEAP